MKTCAACGHQLGLGRFCTNCGHPVDQPTDADWRTDTAERGIARTPEPDVSTARVPPAAMTPPPPPRFPLYADEVPLAAPVEALEPDQPAEPFLTVDEQVGGEVDGPERRSWLSWLAVFLALAVIGVAAYAAWLFGVDNGDSPSERRASESQSPSSSAPAGTTNLAALATVKAPETAPPNQDVDGNLVSYDASNMLDGVPQTAWRTPGDATGMRLTFRLPAPSTLSEVGVLNGYAKRSTDGQGRRFDWYRGNRRVEAVVWDFGNGTKVRQELGSSRAVQAMPIEPVTTRQIVVRLVQVSAPGSGRAGRDFTAISEISMIGVPG